VHINKKLIMAIFAMMLALLITSCGDGSGDAVDTGAVSGDTTAAEDTTAVVEEVEKTKEEIVAEAITALSDKTYDNDEIRFFVRSLAKNRFWGSQEIYAESENNQPINDAVYKRNMYIEDTFKVKIAQTEANTDSLTTEARTLMLSGDDSNDVYMLPLNTAATLSQEGLFYDLYNVPNINLDSPWWDDAAERAFAFGNKMYFTIGDISILDKVATRGIYFNKDMIKSYNLENPYELVANNEWTLEKMYEMGKKVYSDVDSNGVLNDLDVYGLLYEQHSLPQMYLAMGGSTVELNASGEFDITFMSEKNQTLITRVMDFLYDKDVCYCYNSSVHPRTVPSGLSIRVLFEEGHGLFWECGFNNLELMRATETDFGIVPAPKYDKDEEFYASYFLGGPAALCIPTTNTELEKTGAIVEALCAQSSITLMPAYYDTCVEGRYTRDEEAVEMLDILFANRRYDMGCIFTDTTIYNNLMGLAKLGDINVSSMWAKVEPSFTKVMNEVSENWK